MRKLKYIIAKGLKIVLNPPAMNHCRVDRTAKICARSELTNCCIGRYTYIGYQNFLVHVEVGNFCSIADRCSIGGAMHPIQFVSTSPVFHKGNNVLNKNFATHEIANTPKTIIDHDVWIGQGAFLKAGIHISTGAIIGMGAVVTHDVGPYEIWGGNPARLIKKRFDENTIHELLDSRWWELPDEQLTKLARYFDNPREFLASFECRNQETGVE